MAGVFIALLIGILLSAAYFTTDVHIQSSMERESAQQAFYAAETGLEMAVFELRRNNKWTPPAGQVTITHGGAAASTGFYTLRVAPAPAMPAFPTFPSVWVRSDGQDPNKEITRTILARLLLFNPADFFVSSLADFRLGSGSWYHGDLLGRDIYFEVNDSLPDTDPDKKIVVDGNVYYFRNVYGDGDPNVQFLKDTPQPFASITFPGIDASRYRDLAQSGGLYVVGDYNAPLNITRASVGTGNGVVFAEGNIHISGQYDESLLFVAGGDIYLTGDLIASPLMVPKPQLGLFAKQDVIIPSASPSSMTVEAFVVADGGGASYGQLDAQGTKYSKDTFNFNGAMSLRGLQDDGSVPRTAVDLNVYQNRNYQYNPQLTAACTIPFISFVANVINWEEINPNDVWPPP